MPKAHNVRPASALERTLHRLEDLCRERGQRLSRPRRAVLAKLLSARRPLSAYELLDLLRSEDGRSTAASVYRTIDFLMALGIVHRLESTRSFVLCEHPDGPHWVQFLICRRCGQVVEAEDERVAAATERLGQRLGFALDQHIVELTGVCESCRGSRAPH